jgi:long-chain-fatty-acid--CoA ligase ACSBG
MILSTPSLDWCKEIGSKAKTVEEAIADPAVKKAIQEGIDRANSKATSNAQRVQKWSFVPVDFSVPGGELGPTLKLKRHYVVKKYDTQIKNFYNC